MSERTLYERKFNAIGGHGVRKGWERHVMGCRKGQKFVHIKLQATHAGKSFASSSFGMCTQESPEWRSRTHT